MPDRDQLYTALRNADAAGDTAAAQRLSGYIKALPAADAAPAPTPPAPSKPFGQQLNDAIHDAPRQLGLTARYGLEGAGNVFDALVGNPVRTLAAPVFGNKPTADTGKELADLARLPQPATAKERMVGDATRMLAGGAVPIAAAGRFAQGATGIARGVATQLAANPISQLASAGAAGAAGGYTRETGGDDTSQTIAALAAGIAAPFAINKVANLPRLAARAAPTPQQIDITINNALQGGPGGVSFSDLADGVQTGIRKDVADAYKLTGNVTPDAIRRLADYRATGANPTAATLTLDPAIVSQQKNLAKLGINSKDATAQALGQTENANNRALIDNINRLGVGGSPVEGGRQIMGALADRNQRADSIIGGLYDKARDSTGRSAPLDHVAFTQRAGDLLHDANVESFLTPDIRNKLNGFATGQIPLNVEIAEQLKTGMGRIQRSTADGNTRHALGLVRQALDETPLINSAPTQVPSVGSLPQLGGASNVGQDAIDAFNKARGMNRSWMQIVERTPALQAVRDGIEPDKFVQQYIVGNGGKSNIADVNALYSSIKSNPAAVQAVKGQIIAHLKDKALNGAADEVGKISQSAYNKALTGIGDEKLNRFFSKPEVDQLKAIGRVASYEQFQPVGAAVNNSNTAAAGLSGVFDRIANSPLLSKVPFGKMLAEPAQNISVGINSGRALNVPSAIAAPKLAAPRQRVGLLASPALLMSDQSDDEKKRQRGLLSRE